MKQSLSIDTKRIKLFWNRVPLFLAKQSFGVILILFVASLIIGFFVYYNYLVLAQNKPIDSADREIRFNEERFEELLTKQQERKTRFDETDSRVYPDLFRL